MKKDLARKNETELHGNTKRAAPLYDFTVRVLKREFDGRMLQRPRPDGSGYLHHSPCGDHLMYAAGIPAYSA
ncbi:MAG TPA: hypothetical protein VFB95_06150, partial [Candidatus Cryosericum sp.]|nr:hypothetical protein [Candidatus Cryosericum sp.]